MYLGVDFGTTNSQIAAFYQENAVELNERGDYGVPSVFYYDKEVGELVGIDAVNEAKIQSKNVVRNVKMHMGQKFTLDSKEFTSEEIIKQIYKETLELGIRAGEQFVDFSVDGIVVSHPAKFNMLEVNTLCDLARNCLGNDKPLTIIGTIKEPVAAALTYYHDKDVKIPEGAGVLVYDLGGGTCDIALVCKDSSELSEYKVIDSEMLTIGGRDWDQALYEYVAENIRENLEDGDAILKNYQNRYHILEEVQNTKKMLSKRFSTRVRLSLVDSEGKSLPYNIEITRTIFDQITEGLLNETVNKLEEVYNRYRETVDIREIVLVGGSSNMPQVMETIKGKFSELTTRIYHSETAVVCGTAIYAHKVMTKFKDLGYDINQLKAQESVEDVIKRPASILLNYEGMSVVSDVLPFSYGVRCRKNNVSSEFYVKNLIIKGSNMPISGKYNFQASEDSRSVLIEIYESDNSDLVYLCDSGKNERQVVQILLDAPNGIKAGDTVECKLTITSVDIIEVDAKDQNGNTINAKVELSNQILDIRN